MKISEISNKDIEEIKELARRAILESVDASDDIKEEIIAGTMSHIDKNSSNSECIFLKYAKPEVLGFILVQDYWNLSDLFVLPESHGKGAGKALFDAAIAACIPKQNKGYIRVNSSLNAEGFYRNAGFEACTTTKRFAVLLYRLYTTSNKVLNSFVTLTKMLRFYLAAHPLARR